ncbi:MAG TPA: antibiotic biosynthesis monooxygenase [Betaproteobacteria bacterium]|nr:antibiotic biosynthesis monooxygenase [Betaproteobacteria bacterium]
MFIAMNRFKIAIGHENDFIEMWKSRESHLDSVPGFKAFHLLQGSSDENCTLFASHSVWESADSFNAWTQSDAFRKAHAHASGAKDIYLGPPQFEGFEAVI